MTDEANTCVEILKKAARFGVSDCQYCPAYSVCPTGTAGWNNECMLETAADLIESLSAELEQVKRERDAAVEDMRGRCFACAHARPHDKYPNLNVCQFIPVALGGQGVRECELWQWRGVQE